MMKVLTLILPLKHGRISAWTTKTASSHNCFFLPQFLYFPHATYKHTYTYKKNSYEWLHGLLLHTQTYIKSLIS